MKPNLLEGIRDENCSLCPMSSKVNSPRMVCQIPRITKRPEVLIVMKNNPSERLLRELEERIEQLPGGYRPWTAVGVVKCTVWNQNIGKKDLITCARTYLDQEIERLRPKLIIAMGNEALIALTGRTGITKYRGQNFTTPSGVPVYPTISPGMVARNPGLEAGFVADLRNTLSLDGSEASSGRFNVRPLAVMTVRGLKRFKEALNAAYGISYDIESTSFDEYRPDSRMVSLSVTMWSEGATGPEECWVVPLYHPQSPFTSKWREVVRRTWGQVNWDNIHEVVAHNGKFDCRWLNRFSGSETKQTFDTMLAAHLLDEARPKGLKPLAQTLLGVPPWAIDTRSLIETPIKKVLLYNGQDTWYTAWLYFILREQLEKQPRLKAIMDRLMMPASAEFTEIEARGIWVDRDLLFSRKKEAEETLAAIDAKLLEYVPSDPPFPPNFNPSNFSRWFLFEHLGLPVKARGKAKEDGTPGQPSMAEAVMQHLQDEHPHPVIDLMLERTKWQKYSSAFFAAYAEQIDEEDRIHTTFKLTGTVTGRLSSGKGDAEKVTGRVQNRGVNLQQVPRDSFVRGLFGAPEGSVFVECDYSQVELRVAAFMAQEPTMLALYRTGQDIHTTMAQRMVGRVEVTKEERKKAKAVNFGFLYGMGWRKFIETAWSNYGVKVTEEEAKAFRVAFFDQFPKLLEWHNKQRRLVRRYKRVESPLGRVRHLPDIDSKDDDVRAEAQRQSINSPVQSFASDMCVLSLNRLMSIFRARGYAASSVGTVHDAINFEVPISEVPRVVPLIRYVMENLPLQDWFGVTLNVPIVADVKIGTRWGEAEEVAGEISSSPKALRKWLKERSLHAV